MCIRLEEMTWAEVDAAQREGFHSALVVLGSIEQHGPHLPLGTDTLLGYAWGEAIARRLGHTLLAPVVRPGLSSHHQGFAGTLTLEEETFQDTVAQVCQSLARAGFRVILLFCSHGGNWPAVFVLREHLERGLPKGTQLVLPDRETVDDIEREIYMFLGGKGIEEPVAGIHAGLRETSHVLDIAPASVRTDRAILGSTESDVIDLLRLGKPIAEISSSGVLGDATGASAELGRELNELVVKLYADALQAALRPDSGRETDGA